MHPLELGLCEPVGGAAARRYGLGAVEAVTVEVDVLLRRVPRLVRIVVVDEHEERLAVFRHLEVFGRLGEDLRGEPILLALAAQGVRPVLAHDLLSVRGARAADQGVFHLLIGSRRLGPEVVPLLAPDEVEGVEAPVHVVEVPERERPYTRVDRAPRQDGWEGLGVRAVEAQALLGEGVEVGGLYPVVSVDAEVVPSQAVYDHQYYVHSRSPARKVLFGHLCKAVGQAAAPGRAEHGSPGGPRTGHLEKVPAREGTLLHPSPPGTRGQARASGSPLPPRPAYFCRAKSVFVSICKAFSTKSNQPPKIVANSALLRRTLVEEHGLHTLFRPETRTGGEAGLMYARQQTILGKDGYALTYKKHGRSSLPGAVLVNWLVTGGCGFIGTALIRSLMEEGGHAVRVVDNLSVGTREDLAAAGDLVEVSSDGLGPMVSGEQLELVAGDIMDDDLALRAAGDAEVIVHFAANTGVMPSVEDPRGDCMSNVVGTLNYLEAARHSGVGRFIFASSGGTIVGEAEPPIHEEMPPHPVAPYGASKLAGEGYCSAYFRTFGVETVALRFGNVYGPLSGHKNSVVARFIKKAVEGEVLEIYGDGTQTRDFIYVDDLIRAVRLSATVDGVGGEIFQIATSAETTVQELTDRLLPALVAAGIEDIEVRKTAARRGEVRRNYADTSKAQRMLGWKAEVGLDEGLRCTVDWFVGG